MYCNLAYIRCSSETHKRLKTEAATRGTSMQALLDEAVYSLFVHAENEAISPIPRSLIPVIEFIIDAFSEKGAPDEEMWKNTLRMLAAQRSAELKGGKNSSKSKRNVS